MEGESAAAAPSAETAPFKPLTVVYCGVCGLPPEYCDWNPANPELPKCRAWARENCPELLPNKKADQPSGAQNSAGTSAELQGGADDGKAGEEDDGEAAEGGEPGDKKRRKRGGKGVPKPKKEEPRAGPVEISKAQRSKNKWVTTVGGLEQRGVNLKQACTIIRKKLGTGATINKEEGTIEIQGDVTDEVSDIITGQAEWKIDEDDIEDMGECKAKKTRSKNARPKGAASRGAKTLASQLSAAD